MGDELATIVDGALDAHSVRGKRVAVALSGGLDSVVLLNLLHERCTVRELSLSAIHVNHQLSSHADEWEHFCRALCERYGVGFIVRLGHRSGGAPTALSRVCLGRCRFRRTRPSSG